MEEETPQTRCWVCGLLVSNFGRKEPPPIIHKKRGKTSSAVHFVAAEKLEKALPDKYFASSLFRMILHWGPGNGPPEHDVSGIGYMPGAASLGRLYLLPRRHLACIGTPRLDSPKVNLVWLVCHLLPGTIFGQNVRSCFYPRGRPDGYVVHARCWTLIEKWVDGWERLDLLLLGLDEYWEMMTNERESELYPLVHEPPAKPPDPVYIPALKKLLEESVQRQLKKTRRMTRSRSMIAPPARVLTGRYRLPAEILYMIFDYLEFDEIVMCVNALEEELPGAFWAKRFPSHIHFEVGEIDPEKIDWGYLTAGMRETELREQLVYRETIFQRLKVVAGYMKEFQNRPVDGSP